MKRIDSAYPDEVSGSLSHVPFSKHVILIAYADVTGAVTQRCCEAAFSKVAQQKHSSTLHLLLTVCHLQYILTHLANIACLARSIQAAQPPQVLAYL